MKIDGMDAAAIQKVPVSQDTRSTFTNDKSISQNTSQIVQGKNISQITDFEKKELPVAEKVIIDAIERANKAISGGNRRFEFAIHQKTKEIMIKVIDSDTNETIREIPPEKTLDMVARMWEMAGIMVDERR